MSPLFKNVRIVFFIFLLVCFHSVFAHKGKPSFVLEEFSKLTDQIDLENPGSTTTNTLETLLKQGGEKEKDSEVFRKALPIVVELGKTSDVKSKQKLYTELVSLLEQVIGYHDRSGAVLYHCPKTGKSWITNFSNAQNPFDRKNKSCIQKKE